jgi:hypothetical protein
MKTVLEQLMEVNEKLSLIEKAVFGDNSEEFTPCCTDECTCEEPEKMEHTKFTISADDNGPEFDSAGFSEADREPEVEQIITFTKKELIILAAKLMERTIEATKEAVTDTDLDADNLVSLDLGYSYQIDIELDKDQIVKSIHDEIDNTIELDNDSVEDELYDILREMEKLS